MLFDADGFTSIDVGSTATADATGWFAAHELRTPLQGIQGGVALLLEERGAGLSPLQLEALGLISKATADLERCIAQLTELAAIKASPPERLERVAVASLLTSLPSAQLLGQEASLAATNNLEVLVAPALVCRALQHLAALARRGGTVEGLGCKIDAITDDRIELSFASAPLASGDGAVAWQVVAALVQQAGGHLQAGSGTKTRLTLRRAR